MVDYRLDYGTSDPVGQFQSGAQGMQKLAAGNIENQGNSLALAQKKMAALGDILYNITPENYSQRRNIAINSGLATPDQVPEQYDPSFIENVKGSHTQAMQSIADKKAQADLDLVKAHAKYFESGGASGGGGATGAVIKQLMDENPNMTYADALAFFKGGANQGINYNQGIAAPIEGYANAKGNISHGNKLGEQNAILETARPIESEKLKAELEYKPTIAQATEKSKYLAEQGNNLNEQVAVLPQLEDTVRKLSDLGKVATYTAAGKGYNLAKKELGLGSTPGATARTEYMTLVDNQILPLLRQTFGAQFTQREGESLRATLGAPDSTPEQKDAVLRSFIDQKKANIATGQRKLGLPQESFSTSTESVDPYQKARDAIASGKSRAAVEKRLIENGLDPRRLNQ